MTRKFDDPQDVLAATVWGEARNQGRGGMEAVASVVMNRARHPSWWGNSVISVCLKPMQFSCWNTGDPNKAKLLAVTGADPQFTTALYVAEEALTYKLFDLTNGADSYYSGERVPIWARSRSPCAIIGAHRFFRVELP